LAGFGIADQSPRCEQGAMKILSAMENTQVRYALLWLLGVPIPVLILIYFLVR
jgi:hypothetical protein